MAESKTETPVANIKRDKCHCPICLEEVRKPKYLPCYHTFCEPCIQTYISSTAAHKETNTVKSIECPVCRRCVNAPRENISSEEWALELPTNKLVLTLSVDPEQDENKNCMFCTRAEKTVPARYWCKICMEAICEDCKSFHRLVPSLQDHKITNLANIKEVNSEIEIEETCLFHKEKVLDVFCHDHQQLCCSVCLVKQHKSCKNVDTIEDTALTVDRDYIQDIVSKYIGLGKNVEDMMLEKLNLKAELSTKKQDICMKTEEKVEEIKSLLDNAHAKWLKQFEQIHADSIGNIEIAYDELKRFFTTVNEASAILQSVLKSGSSKQLFITNLKLQNQMNDHISHLKSLKIWNFPKDYQQHNSDFLSQISISKEFEDVVLSKEQSWIVEKILMSSPVVGDKENILQRRKKMCQKDWMKVNLRKLSQIEKLSETVYYGLFVSDTMIVLSHTSPPSLKIYDISYSTGECVHTEMCEQKPYGLCHSGWSLNEIYVSFKRFINHYRIDVAKSITFTKLRTIHLKQQMLAISRGPTTVFAANRSARIICSLDFCIKHSLPYKPSGDVPFVSSSLVSDTHSFIRDGMIITVDQNNKEISMSPGDQKFRGLSFDLEDNILVCNRSSKLKQFKHGFVESRDIDPADTDMNDSYNIILHPAGEKILLLDLFQQCSVYQVS
ncbi:tripartite motif-containing protein 5-like [Saccostrea cucullata]|uniref:tripartite motif-containing protein 5-like n=1 Tax=Saccostrea cuccullata TaxID=36930 RepID=UPI002ED25C2D